MNAAVNGYTTHLGYDNTHPLIFFPTSVGGKETTHMSDYYWQETENRIVLVGGLWYDSIRCGLWSWNLGENSSSVWKAFGARLLRYR